MLELDPFITFLNVKLFLEFIVRHFLGVPLCGPSSSELRSLRLSFVFGPCSDPVWPVIFVHISYHKQVKEPPFLQHPEIIEFFGYWEHFLLG